MQRVEQHPQHSAIAAQFPGVKLDGGGLTIAQARLCGAQERLLYGQPAARAAYLHVADVLGVPEMIGTMSDYDAARALVCVEAVARVYWVMGRDPRTGWEEAMRKAGAPDLTGGPANAEFMGALVDVVREHRG